MRNRLLLLVFGMVFGTGIAAAQNQDVTATAYQTVNVRSGPDTRFDIVGQLAQGDTVTVNGRESESTRWLQVTLDDGQTGWVASFTVIIDGSVAGLPVIEATPTANTTEAVTVVAYGLVNVRSGPAMSYEIVGQLDVGDEAEATARSDTHNDWLRIENDDIEGWVAYFTVSVRGDPDSLPVLVPGGPGEALVPLSMVATTRFNVRLHTDPERSSPTLLVVPFASNVTLLARSEDGSWLYVLYGETPGWGVTRLFDVTPEQLALIPLYTPEFTPEAPVEATPEATAEAG